MSKLLDSQNCFLTPAENILDPNVMACEMRTKLQANTSDVIGKMSEYALTNPAFSRKFTQTICEKKIKRLKLRDEARERERRRQARIKALALGYNLKDFNFNDEKVLLNFGIKPTRVFSAEKFSDNEENVTEKKDIKRKMSL